MLADTKELIFSPLFYTAIMVGENRPVSIVTTSVGKEVPCKVTVTTPKNMVSELPTFKTADGHGTAFTPSEIGPHKVKVECAGQDVPGSPFNVMVEKKSIRPVVKGLETREFQSNLILFVISKHM